MGFVFLAVFTLLFACNATARLACNAKVDLICKDQNAFLAPQIAYNAILFLAILAILNTFY